MKKIFLTSGLAIFVAGSAFGNTLPPAVHDIDTNNHLVDTNPVQDATCQYPTLGSYIGPSTFYAKWTANSYNITYAPGDHGTGGQTLTNAATYDANYVIRGLGSDTATKSGVTANTGYTFQGWLGLSTGNNPDTTYNARPSQHQTQADRWYDETETISPYTVAGDLTLTAQWRHNIATITLNSSIYSNNAISVNGTPKYNQDTNADGITKANPSTVYSAYDIGLFPSLAEAKAGETGLYGSGSPASHITIPSRVGYAFEGFYNLAQTPVQLIDENGIPTTAAKTEVSTDNGSATWYAHWKPKTYTITFKKGSTPKSAVTGSAPTSETFKFDETKQLTANAYEAVGYTFNGWTPTKNLEAEDGATPPESYSDGESITYKYDGQDAELTAIWDPNKSGTITLDADIYANNDRSNNAQPLYVNAPQNGEPELDTALGNSTVYSIYGVGLYTTQAFTTPVTPANLVPAKTGYTFNGFYTSNNTPVIGSNGSVLDAALVQVSETGHTDTWYAHWTVNSHTITYTCGDVPTGAPSGTAFTSQTAPTYSYPNNGSGLPYDSTFTLATTAGNGCVLQGYHFTGWVCDHNLTSGATTNTPYAGTQVGNDVNSFSVSATGTFKVDDDVICKAQWAANTITTNWNANGGTAVGGGTYSQGAQAGSCTYDDVIHMGAVPERTGYTFKGWSTTQTVVP